MEPELDRERQQAHALLDRLSAEKLTTVRTLLEMLVDRAEHTPAPAKQEEPTPAADASRGEGMPPEEILRKFGLMK